MSDYRKLLRELERQGFTWRKTGTNHYFVAGPDGKWITTLPSTPSEYRGFKNAIAILRRAGFKWEGR